MKIISKLFMPSFLVLCGVFALNTPVVAKVAPQAKAPAPKIAPESKAQNAESFISDLGERAIKSLTQGDQASIDTTFLSLLDEGFDLDYIARFVLGRYWKSFNEAQRSEFKTIFRERLKNSYAIRFKEYKGVTFKVKSSHSENGNEIVETTIQKPSGPITPVQWEVEHKGSGYKIRDVVVEGVSMSQTIRSDYYAAYQNAGGTPEKFLESIKPKS